jgi:Flp pilus assembly protein TadG
MNIITAKKSSLSNKSINKIAAKKPLSYGATLLELALAIPVMIGLMLGALDLANYYRSKTAIQQASEEVLRCLASLTDCSQSPNANNEALYQIYSYSDTPEATLPYMRLNGTITGSVYPNIQATEYTVQYVASANVINNGKTTLPTASVSYTVRSSQGAVNLTSNGTYSLSNAGYVQNIALPGNSTVSPTNRTVVIRFTTPPVPTELRNNGSRCVVDSLNNAITNNGTCNQAEINGTSNFFMLLLEGTASGGQIGEKSTVEMDVRETSGTDTFDLTGQIFNNPGSNESAREPFVPRGATYFSTNNSSWTHPTSEYRGHKHSLKLKYNTRYEVVLRLTPNSTASWRPSALKIALPRYENDTRDFNCKDEDTVSVTHQTGLTLPNDTVCKLSDDDAKYLAYLTKNGANPVIAHASPETKDPSIQDTIPCQGETIVAGIPNYGIPENPDADGVVKSSNVASGVCGSLPPNTTPVSFNIANATVRISDLKDIEAPIARRRNCHSEPGDSELIPEDLKRFHHIAVSRRLEKNNHSDFVKYDTSRDQISDYACFNVRTVNVEDYLNENFGASTFSNNELQCNDALSVMKSMERLASPVVRPTVTMHKSAKRYKVPTDATIPSCLSPNDLYIGLTEDLTQRPLNVGAMKLEQAKEYCAKNNLSCSYKLLSFTDLSKNELHTFKTEKARAKGNALLAAISSKYGLTEAIVNPTATLTAEGAELVSVTTSAKVPSIIKRLFSPNNNSMVVSYSAQRMSERGLLH